VVWKHSRISDTNCDYTV